MHAYLIENQYSNLADWGAPEDIGAATKSGSIRISGKIDLGSPESPVFGGLYAATRGVYSVVYPFHEHATLLDGQLLLTDESTGTSNLYGAGDSWLVRKGTPVRWEIKSDRVLKSFLATTTDL
ncbi:hypothetical protein CN934_30500 [Ensifer sp. MMN_5]|nr:hypothetical protein CN934_30500 [Ensifer sp. MMN_5]